MLVHVCPFNMLLQICLYFRKVFFNFIFRYLFWFSVLVTLNACLLDIPLYIFFIYCFLFKPFKYFSFFYLSCLMSSAVSLLFVLLFVSSFLLSFCLFSCFFLSSLFLLSTQFFLAFLCFVIVMMGVTSLTFLGLCKDSYNFYVHCNIFLASILWHLVHYVAHFHHISYIS